MILVLIILLFLFCVGGLPTWGYHQLGYAPSGLFGLVLVVLLIFFLTGRRF